MNRQELKTAAFKERLSTLTANYEEEIANLRVDYTVLVEESRNLEARVEELQNELERLREETADAPEKEEGNYEDGDI